MNIYDLIEGALLAGSLAVLTYAIARPLAAAVRRGGRR